MDVTLPDGTVLNNVPPGTTRAQIAEKLKGAHGTEDSDTPRAAAPEDSGKLGSWASSFVRPVVKGAGGVLTLIPDVATNLVNMVPESILGPKMQPPGEFLNQKLDQYTTAPQDRLGKVGEFINSSLVGGMVGPRMPTVSPASPAVQRLAHEGVTMTPGQVRGGLANRIEEKAGKILPPIGNARVRAVEQWNNARLRESLRDAGGQALPADLTGRDAIRHTYQQLQQRYGQVLGRMRADLNSGAGGNLPVARGGQQWSPGSLRDNIERVRTVGAHLDPAQRNTLNDIIDNQFVGKFTAAGRASGETVKEIEETLRTEAEAHEAGSYQDRRLSQALYQLRQELTNSLNRDNPQLATELQNIDRGYAKYKLSARASNYRPTGSGNYTPGQRLQAIKARDTSKDRNAFSIGRAGGQHEAEEAQRVLGNVDPDSGTPMGMALLQLLGGGAAGAAVSPGLAASVLASPALYSQPMLRFLQQQYLRNGPELMSRLGIAGAAQQDLQ